MFVALAALLTRANSVPVVGQAINLETARLPSRLFNWRDWHMPAIGNSIRRTKLAATLMVVCGGCSSPYTLQISDINLASPQQRAVIALSDAQLYTRSRLINDRQQQIQQIRKWIEDLPNAKFSPQIAREVELIRSLAIDIAAAFNPTGGKQTAREQEIKDKEAELKLLQLQKQIEAVGASEAGDPGNVEAPARDPKTEAVPDASGSEIQTLRQRLAVLEAELKKLAAENAGKEMKESTTEPSPEELLRDRLAYQNELYAALNQVELDDRHDLDGNSLFRLQFRATVFPNKEEGKLGVARVTILPPIMTKETLRELYQGWLLFANQQLNQTDKEEVNKLDLSLLAQTDLFELFTLEEDIRVALSPDDVLAFRKAFTGLSGDLISDLTASEISQTESTKFVNQIGANPPTFVEKETSRCVLASESLRSHDIYMKAVAKLRLRASFLIALRSISDSSAATGLIKRLLKIDEKKAAEEVVNSIRRLAQNEIEENIADLMDKRRQEEEKRNELAIYKISERKAASDRIDGYQKSIDEYRSCLASYDVDLNIGVPTAFERLLVEDALVKDKRPWWGDVFAYSSAPTEYVQRVSSVARASEAFALVAAVSAMIPELGLEVEAGAKLMNQAVGNVHALERAPLVVGFSEHNDDDVARDSAKAYGDVITDEPDIESFPKFGWVFGPRVVLDAENQRLKLQQTLVNQPVTADVSVPGWWPYITARVETAWVGNLADGIFSSTTSSSNANINYMKVPIDGDSASMASLTTLLMERTFGRQSLRATITDIIPSKLDYCPGKEVTFIVRGQNLWRGVRAFLNGREVTKPISILPDMQGIVITFDPADMPSNVGAEGGNVELHLVTQNGVGKEVVTIGKSEAGTGNCSAATKGDEAITGTLATGFINSSQKEVVVRDLINFPRGLHSLQIILVTEEGGTIEPGFEGTPIPGSRSAVFRDVSPNSSYLEGTNGNPLLLTAKLAIRLLKSDGAQFHNLSGQLVFYKDAAAIRAKVRRFNNVGFDDKITGGNLKESQDATADLFLRLPQHVLVAFPKAFQSGDQVVTVENKGKKGTLNWRFVDAPKDHCAKASNDFCHVGIDFYGEALEKELKEAGAKITFESFLNAPGLTPEVVTLQ